MTQIEDQMQSISAAVPAPTAGPARHRPLTTATALVIEFLQHAIKQSTLHRIVIDDL